MDCGALRLAGRAAGTAGATAMNCDPAELASLSRCYCFGSKWRSVMAYIYCQWANNLGPDYPCGTPSNRIQIVGAGAIIPEFWFQLSPTTWKPESAEPPSVQILLAGGIWRIYYFPGLPMYYSTSLQFPCVWTTDTAGTPPAPTGQYV